MPTPIDTELYEQVKNKIYNIYKKPSAYRSGAVVKEYKRLGGRYRDDDKPKNLKTWFKSEWKDIGGLDYPVYRPTKRVNKNTPLTVKEIDPKNLVKQIKLKQIYKGDKNLPPFLSK
jgi:hypothetical protein